MAITAEDRRKALRHLSGLTEVQLRQDVLVPLYRALGFHDVVENHGQDEYGKDILFKDATRFGDPLYLASLVKRGTIHGTSSKPGNAAEVLSQAREAFEVPFKDRFDNFIEKHIAMLFVVASEEITSKAREYISRALSKGGVTGSLRFHDGEILISLLDQHIPSILDFWLRPTSHAGFATTARRRDFYPTLEVFIRHSSMAAPIAVSADFDTGANQSFISAEFLERHGVGWSPLSTPQLAVHAGRQYVYEIRRFEVSLDSSHFVSVPLAVVRDWAASTFTVIHPTRVMLLGRDVPLAVGAKVSLDFSEASSQS